MNGLPDLNFFIQLVQSGSLSALARTLRISPSAISMKLSNLEKELGIRLLNRSTRKISLTNEGEIYYTRGLSIISDLSDLNSEISSGRTSPKGTLKILAPIFMGRELISPIVFDFMKKNPAIKIHLDTTPELVNQIEHGYDICIKFGDPPDSRMIARKIYEDKRYICASPLYLDASGSPTHPKQLKDHQCLVVRNSDSSHSWEMTKESQIENIKVDGNLSCTDASILLEWALKGKGIILTGEWCSKKYISSGRLKPILTDWKIDNKSLYAIYPERLNVSARTMAFINFMEEVLHR